ncbi:MAG: maleylpyruvate isomerase family mycothiol-dependent enzyme [Sporichthyaceae bacterium]
MDSTELLSSTRDAIAAATERVGELIASIPDPLAPVPDSPWTVRDFAAHLILAGTQYTDMAQGVPSVYQSIEPTYLHAEFTRRQADIAESDPTKLSRLFVDAMEGFLDATSDLAGDTSVIMHGQNTHTVAGMAGVLLGEEVLHGYDISTATGRPWPLDPADTALVLAGYAPVFGWVVNPERAQGLSAGFGIELRGVAELTVRFTDGVYALEDAGSAPVDATIYADPIAFLMVASGRLSRYEAIALGLVSVSGNRPDLAIGFWDLFRYP